MSDEKIEKTIKDVKGVGIVILVINIVYLIIILTSGRMNGIATLILSSIFIVVTNIGYNQRKIYGPICGILAAILLFLCGDVILGVTGLIYFIANVYLIKYLK